MGSARSRPHFSWVGIAPRNPWQDWEDGPSNQREGVVEMVLVAREGMVDDLPVIKHLLAHNNALRWPALPLSDAAWKARLARDGNGTVVAVANEVVVGVTAVEMAHGAAEVGRLAYASQSGVGEALVAATEAYAREQGAAQLTYRLVGERGALLDLLRACGYEEAEGWPEYERYDLGKVAEPEVAFRALTPQDLEAVVRIDRTAFGDVAYPRGLVEEMLSTPAYRLLGIEQEGELVAFSVACMLPEGIGYFMKTATLPEHRGAGLGGALCAAVLRDFHSMGATRVWAHTWDGNYRGMHLLEKYQFRRTGRSLVMRRQL